MFKNLEKAWNARTPVYLHNGTKENIIFQLSLVGVLIGGYWVHDVWTERKAEKKRQNLKIVQ